MAVEPDAKEDPDLMELDEPEWEEKSDQWVKRYLNKIASELQKRKYKDLRGDALRDQAHLLLVSINAGRAAMRDHLNKGLNGEDESKEQEERRQRIMQQLKENQQKKDKKNQSLVCFVSIFLYSVLYLVKWLTGHSSVRFSPPAISVVIFITIGYGICNM